MQRIAAKRFPSARPFSARPIRPGGKWGKAARAAALLLASGVAIAQAQTKRCDLVGRDTTISGNTTAFKKCLDLSALDGKTVNVPSNVTRIDNDGLSLCKGAVTSGGDADIVYVYDNSGSMRGYTSNSRDRSYRRAWVSSDGTDTLFYYDDGDCSETTTSGWVVFMRWTPDGTAMARDSVSRLVSRTGCTHFAGDPYNARGQALWAGLKRQSDEAPTSTAGIMAFTETVDYFQRPLSMSPANLTILQNNILANSRGGTSYRPPIDSAKLWLTSSSITSNPKKAIVFISDGRPMDGFTTPPTGTPPIYGIFLGSPKPDTAVLSSMSQATGGKFYLIPPNKPDSLTAVVNAILNIVLLEYEPQSATVTNTSLSPAQTSTSSVSDFILQPDGSWLMKLSDIIGLKAGSPNTITVSTTFKEKTSGTPDSKNITFTISTTKPASNTTQKIDSTQFGMACYDHSSLTILDAANARPPYFTDANTAYTVRIRTSPAPLDSARPSAATGAKNDAESPLLKPPLLAASDSLVFRNSFPFQVTGNARTAGNGTLESSIYDSIIVAWTHPRDAQDFVADTLRVRPRGVASQAWFSLANGGPATTQYPATTSTVYVVVKDQLPAPGKTYTAVVTSETFSLDRETITLSQIRPGSDTLVGKITVANDAKAQGNGKLEVSVGGDQLRVVYRDPVDGDSAQATAGFDQLVEEAPVLRFTEADGTPLAPGTIWSPAKGKLYFDYSDDDVGGTIAGKQISLTLAGKKYGVTLGTDHEGVSAAYAGSLSSTRGHWKGSIDLAEGAPVDSDGAAQTRYRGEASISAIAHSNKGADQALTATDVLVIAYPDSAAGIAWKMDTTVSTDEGMIFTVTDQSFTAGKDTVLLSVACLKSGDSVSAVPAAETGSNASGTYQTGTVGKVEGAPNLGDRILSCQTNDQIRVRYVDPVYGGITELVIEEAAKPVATPPGGTFITSERVALSTATPGAAIWYTLDGSKPVPGKAQLYTGPIPISVSDTLKAIAVLAGLKDSKILTEVYTKEAIPSRLEILDENGNSIPGGTLTGASKAVSVKLVTTQDNLTSADVPLSTRSAGDAETAFLHLVGSLGNAIELSTQIALRSPGAADAGNDTVEAAGNDTLIARWTNPFNPADVAADTVIIKPAFVAAEVYFSATENGPRITQYPVNTDTVYIVVKTRPRDPNLAYTVALTSSEGGRDSETVALTEASPGVFTGKAKVGTDAKAKGDKVIQVAASGDQLTAVFVDPVYKDAYSGNAGFAQQVQESAQLDFIDGNGNLVAPGEIWSPAKGKVYVRYSDDWNAGIDSLIAKKTVRFTLVNRKSGDSVGADAEILLISLKSHTATRGTWEGSLALTDRTPARSGNDTLEAYYRGELHAAVTPHDNAGAAMPGDAGDDLVIAYPDQPGEIIVRDAAGGQVERKTDKVEIIIHDQLVTKSGQATIIATASCAQTGDKVDKIILVWDGSQYVAQPPLDKGETNSGNPDKTDKILQCRDTDVLTVVYVDPVFGTQRATEVRWSDDTPSDMWYASVKDTSRITSATDGANKFLVVVKGKSPNRDKVDTVVVTLALGPKESETYRAVETGAFTGLFVVQAEFRFQTDAPESGNKMLEAVIDAGKKINQAVVEGSADLGGSDLKAELTLISIFDRAVAGWAKDEDGDGAADHLYFRFDHALPRLPASLPEAYWNEAESGFRKTAGSGQLSFAKGDTALVIADFTKSQFGAGLTGIPEGKKAPYALFPDDNLFGGQKAFLADSVGPIPLTAVKLPSNGQTYAVTEDERRFVPDTLVITVSEKLTSATSISGLFRFSKGCRDYSESVPLKLFGLPEISADGITYRAVVDNALETQTPLVGDCVFLEKDGRFTDMKGNLPAAVGAEITGTDPKLVIRTFKGYPPVAGISAESPGFTTANQDDVTEGTFRRETGIDRNVEVIWVPPVGFNPRNPVGSLEDAARDFYDNQTGNRAGESAHPQPMPSGISTVQVITSTAYLARITIFDNMGNFVRQMTQAFGHNGELRNGSRTVEGGQVSFLVWDMKDSHGIEVGQGVYVWKVAFTFSDGNRKSEVRYTRTGVLRR